MRAGAGLRALAQCFDHRPHKTSHGVAHTFAKLSVKSYGLSMKKHINLHCYMSKISNLLQSEKYVLNNLPTNILRTALSQIKEFSHRYTNEMKDKCQ